MVLDCIYWCNSVSEIGTSVELDTLAQKLVHLNQPTQIAHGINNPLSDTFLDARAAGSPTCSLLFTGSYVYRPVGIEPNTKFYC